MIKPESMSIFITLCDQLSFTKTAEKLHLPKSTVSDSIKSLEATLDTQLIRRTTRKVYITKEGYKFLEKAKFLIDELKMSEQMFKETDKELEGTVRIDMPIQIAKNAILPKLQIFLEKYPKVSFEISGTDQNIDLISKGIDFTIRAGKLKDSGLVCKKIGQHQVINVVGKNYIEKFGRPNIKNIKNHYQIHYLQNFGIGQDYFEYIKDNELKKIKLKSFMTVNNSITYLEACLKGFGIAQIPKTGIEKHLEEGELIEILPKYRMSPMNVYIISPQRTYRSNLVQEAMKWFEETIKSYIN